MMYVDLERGDPHNCDASGLVVSNLVCVTELQGDRSGE